MRLAKWATRAKLHGPRMEAVVFIGHYALGPPRLKNKTPYWIKAKYSWVVRGLFVQTQRLKIGVTVNPLVAGSSPTRGAKYLLSIN
jgi:hypothetical protein